MKKLPGDSTKKGTIAESNLLIINHNLPRCNTKIPDVTNASTQTENDTQKDTKHFNEYRILKQSTTNDNNLLKRMFPRLPYHKRLEMYNVKRKEIFENTVISQIDQKHHSKRSTRRLREFYKRRKYCSKLLVSSIISNSKDGRFYAKVSFLNFVELGLLDTGASISCIGADLARKDFSKFPNFSKYKSFVKTAHGNVQPVVGWLNVNMTFKGKTENIDLFVIPSISQRLLLGVDFWRKFQLLPNIIESVDIIDRSSLDFSSFEVFNCKAQECLCDDDQGDKLEGQEENFYKFTVEQRQQFDAVISVFPNFEKQGLGRTSLIKHEIDVGSAKPIKQGFYPVSPVVEKLMFKEIDRMLELGVIEPSSSAWSSPMRLVIKPNKIRLCLDAHKVNSVTKKTHIHYHR